MSRRWIIPLVLMLVCGSGCPGCSRSAVDSGRAPGESGLDYTAEDTRLIRRFRFSEPHMGVSCRITIFHWSEDAATRGADAAFREIARLNGMLSDYLPESDINRLCDRAGSGPVAIDSELAELLVRCDELTRMTEGAFDISYGALYTLWREARRNGTWPDDAAVEAAHRTGGMAFLQVTTGPDTAAAEVTLPGVRLDFGGIGKGYAAQRAAEALIEHDCPYSLVDIGGDIVANYAPPEREGWRVLVESGFGHNEFVTIVLQAVATSGASEQFVLHNGKRYSHIIDPRIGTPIADAPSVTVICSDGAVADALASAVSILGRDGWERIAHRFADAHVIIHER